MRTGCHWNRLPRELGDGSTIHRTFQRWVELRVLERIWAVLVEECQDRGLCSGSGRLPVAPWARRVLGDSVGRNPTDRGKAGSKRSLLVNGGGGPLSLVVAGANVHDTKLLAITPESIVVERPEAGTEHLCLDKGYDHPTGHEAVAAHGY